MNAVTKPLQFYHVALPECEYVYTCHFLEKKMSQHRNQPMFWRMFSIFLENTFYYNTLTIVVVNPWFLPLFWRDWTYKTNLFLFFARLFWWEEMVNYLSRTSLTRKSWNNGYPKQS